jgi:hypothetical protein
VECGSVILNVVVWPGASDAMLAKVPGTVIRWPMSAVSGVWVAAVSSAVVVSGVEPMNPCTLIAVQVWSEALVTVPWMTIGPLSGT